MMDNVHDIGGKYIAYTLDLIYLNNTNINISLSSDNGDTDIENVIHMKVLYSLVMKVLV